MNEEANIPIDVLRHSAAHLMAHAVLELYPGTRTGIGPAIETGFYYDFLRDEPSARQSPVAFIHGRVRRKWTPGQSPGPRPLSSE